MRISVGSTKPAKVHAAESAFRAVWPYLPIECIACEVSSGVSDQPMSDRETIAGARNRALSARAQEDADFGVGIESGLTEIDGVWFSGGWVVVVDRDDREAVASRISQAVPPAALALVRDGLELGEALDRVVGTPGVGGRGGLIGILTNGLITRESAFRDAVIAALGRFSHPDLF